MPTTTPTFWGADGTVTNDPSSAFGRAVALSNGGFAVVWDGDGADGLGTDIFGRRFDNLGTVLGGDFLSAFSASTTNDLTVPQIVQHTNDSIAVSFTREAALSNFNIGGVLFSPSFTPPGGPFNINTEVADSFLRDHTATINGGSAVVWENSNGALNSSIHLQVLNSVGALVGTPKLVDPTASEEQTNAQVAGLANGAIVVVYQNFNAVSGVRSVRAHLFSATGNPIGGEIIVGDTGNAAIPDVVALANGNFVVTWQDISRGGLFYQVFNSVGAAVSSEFFISTNSLVPHTTALKDGGFIIAWNDIGGTEGDGSPELEIFLQRFDGLGNTVGGRLEVDKPGDQSATDLKTLADGRVLLVYGSETGDSTDVFNIKYRIIDPRDATIAGSPGNDVIVGRDGDTSIFGEDGNDRLTGRAGDDSLNGGAGNDSLDGRFGDDLIKGGSGNDTTLASFGDDTINGGSGIDLVDYSTIAGGGVAANLSTGVATLPDAGSVHQLSSIEQLTGTTSADNFAGNAAANLFFGGAGNDTLSGGGGSDLLRGALGADRQIGGAGTDFFDFNSTTESPATAAGRDTITDFSAADFIDLETIDARTNVAGNQAFTFIGAGPFTGTSGQLRFVVSGPNSVVAGDTNGDGAADLHIVLLGFNTVTAGDFVL